MVKKYKNTNKLLLAISTLNTDTSKIFHLGILLGQGLERTAKGVKMNDDKIIIDGLNMMLASCLEMDKI